MSLPTDDVVHAAEPVRVPVRGGGTFPVHRVYCVGRNFVDHAKEMGVTASAAPEARGEPVFFSKPADAIVIGEDVPYPPATRDLHHEIELVVALGRDAAAGELAVADADALVFGYGVGLDLTRRDLQASAKSKGLPWDTAKGFDASAPLSELVPVAQAGALSARTLSLDVNGETRQRATLDQLIWNVPEILHELSKFYALRAGDLVFMGTPAGVAALAPGDRCVGRLDDLIELRCRIAPRAGA